MVAEITFAAMNFYVLVATLNHEFFIIALRYFLKFIIQLRGVVYTDYFC